MYRKKVSMQLILTDEEREKIAKRIVDFMRSCLVVSDYINEPDNKWQSKYRKYHFWFADRSFGSEYFRVYEENGKFQELIDKKLLDNFIGPGGMFERFSYNIRLNASKPHIEKLMEILGDKVALCYFDYWAKKNIFVALVLENIIKQKGG